MAHVLIVEDESRTADTLKLYLEQNGHVCKISYDGYAGLGMAMAEKFDVVLLDRMLPGLDGLAICQMIKSHQDVYVIFLSAKAGEVDRVEGLDQGADDYVIKPFSLREVLARVNRLMTFHSPYLSPNKISNGHLCVGNAELDVDSHLLKCRDGSVELTATEMQMLSLLMKTPGKPFTKTQLARVANLIEADESVTPLVAHKVTSHMMNVRRKVSRINCSHTIKTVYGQGYVLKYMNPDSLKS